MVTNPNSLTQIDSMDLTVPVKQDYLKYLSLQFPSVIESDILPASLIVSTTKTTTKTTTITTGATSYSTSTNLFTYIEQNNQQSLVSYFLNHENSGRVYLKVFLFKQWWEGLLIALGCLLFLALFIVLFFTIFRNNGIKRSLLSNKSSSDASSMSNNTQNQFDILTNTFPQYDAFTHLTSVTPRSSLDHINYGHGVVQAEPRFSPSAKPSISKNSRSLALFYPGMPIESIVPNPVYVNNPNMEQVIQNIVANNTNTAESQSPKLITSIYVTHVQKATHSDESTNVYENTK